MHTKNAVVLEDIYLYIRSNFTNANWEILRILYFCSWRYLLHIRSNFTNPNWETLRPLYFCKKVHMWEGLREKVPSWNMHVPPKLAGSISEAICKQENQIGREPFTDFVRKFWWPQMVWRHSLHGRSYHENLQYKSHVCRSWDLFQGLIYLKTAFGCQPNHSLCLVHHLPMYLMIKYIIKIKRS